MVGPPAVVGGVDDPPSPDGADASSAPPSSTVPASSAPVPDEPGFPIGVLEPEEDPVELGEDPLEGSDPPELAPASAEPSVPLDEALPEVAEGPPPVFAASVAHPAMASSDSQPANRMTLGKFGIFVDNTFTTPPRSLRTCTRSNDARFVRAQLETHVYAAKGNRAAVEGSTASRANRFDPVARFKCDRSDWSGTPVRRAPRAASKRWYIARERRRSP